MKSAENYFHTLDREKWVLNGWGRREGEEGVGVLRNEGEIQLSALKQTSAQNVSPILKLNDRQLGKQKIP